MINGDENPLESVVVDFLTVDRVLYCFGTKSLSCCG